MSFWNRLGSLFSYTPAQRSQYAPIESILSYKFKDHSLLALGLMHRSAVRIGESEQMSNERLEFLGDSVLGLVIAEQLYREHPEMSEGQLTKTKSMLVNEMALSTLARETELNQHVRMSPEEERAGGRERNSIISDAFEAIIGAVYLDGGFQEAARVVRLMLNKHREKITQDIAQKNFKGELLELAQARGEGAPRYDVVAEEGPDHEKTFHVIVTIAGMQIGEGSGASKKEAEQRAAALAITRYTHQSNQDTT